MRWKSHKAGDVTPWKLVFAIRPVRIGDTWYWWEKYYRRKTCGLVRNGTQQGCLLWTWQVKSIDDVTDILKDPAKGRSASDADGDSYN